MKITEYNTNTTLARFDNVFDFINFVRKGVDNDNNSVNYSRKKFCREDFETAVKNAALGKINLDKLKIETVKNSITEIFPSTEIIPCFDVTGNWLDIDRFLSGEPECFCSEQENHAKENLTIGISISASWNVRQDDLENRAIWIAQTTDYLSQYYNVSVKLYCYLSDLPHYFETRKHYNILTEIPVSAIPLDTRTIVKACSASFLRRLIFGELEIIANEKSLSRYYYGTVDDILEPVIQGRMLYFPSSRRLETYVFSYSTDYVKNIIGRAIKELNEGQRFVIIKQ